MYSQPIRSEKPYQFVSFPPEQLVNQERRKAIGQDRLVEKSLTGWLELELLTITPLQVASGILDFDPKGQGIALAQQSLRGKTGRVAVIPGASLKGALRSLAEALSPSCVSVAGGNVRSLLPKALLRCSDVQKLCPACRIFGMSGKEESYMGRISVTDGVVPLEKLNVVSTPILRTPARGRGRGLPPLYLDRGKLKGRKFYEHRKTAFGPEPRIVIKENTTIQSFLYFSNLSEAELGLIIAALGNHPNHPFPIKIGAGKPIGMGSVEVRVKAAVWLTDGASLRNAGRLGQALTRIEGETLKTRLAEMVKAAEQQGLLLVDKLKEVAKVLDRGNLKKEAPKGPY